MPRQQAKQQLRKISELAIRGILGRVPRKLRRSAGRQFANESWRHLQGLSKRDPRVNDAVIAWVANEYSKL